MPSMADISVMLFPWGGESPAAKEIVAATKLAEDLGFYSATLPTHMTMPPGWLFESFPNHDVLDALAIVPVMAAQTSRIKIGFNSVLLPVLPPYQWAKYLATLDRMSDGRLIVGAAMGWWEEDFTSVGVDRSKRGKLFDEQLELIERLWTEERVTFEGEHYRLADMPMEPKPLQRPHPPIWIGGGIKSVARTAKHGECIVAFWPDAQAAREQWVPRLAEAGAKHGTDPKLATFTFAYVADGERDLEQHRRQARVGIGFETAGVDVDQVSLVAPAEECARRIRALHEAGVWHFVLEFQFHGLETVAFGMRQMERFAERVAPLL